MKTDFFGKVVEKVVEFNHKNPLLRAGFLIVSPNILGEIELSLRDLSPLNLSDNNALDEQWMVNGLSIVVDIDSVDRFDILPVVSFRTQSVLKNRD